MGDAVGEVVARIDERVRSFEGFVKQLADDQRELKNAFQKLVESNQRVALLESDAAAHKESLDVLWKKFDAHIEMHNKVLGHSMFEIAKLIAAAVVGAILSKYGITLSP